MKKVQNTMRQTDKFNEMIDFPELTMEQQDEITFLKNMSDEEIDTSDIPEVVSCN